MPQPSREFSWIVASVAGWLIVLGSFDLVGGNRSTSWIMLSLAAAAITHELAQRKLLFQPENKTMQWTSLSFAL